jgi:predicted ABC-type ATPase
MKIIFQMEYKPTLIVISGPNGSGKTSITTQILKRSLAQASRLCL